MPAFFKLLLTLIILGGLGYGGVIALVNFVEPEPHEISHTVPKSKLKLFRDD
jgi:hypothetical protein